MKIILWFSVFFGSAAHALIPNPTGNQLNSIFGVDSCMKVSEASVPPFTVSVQACSEPVAGAMAALLNTSPNGFSVEVLGPDGKKAVATKISNFNELLAAVEVVLHANPYFSKAYAYDPLGLSANQVLVEFKPMVIRVFIDNISNPYGTSAYVAADLFQMFLSPQIGSLKLMTTTGPQ